MLAIHYSVHKKLLSTQDQARKELEESSDAEGFFWVRAETQLEGRGRQGRVWHKSASEDLAISCAFNINTWSLRQQTCFPLLAGWMLYKACSQLIPKAPLVLKWPNDLCVQENNQLLKIGGILVEGRSRPFAYLTAGWGLNLIRSPPLPHGRSLQALFPDLYKNDWSEKIVSSLQEQLSFEWGHWTDKRMKNLFNDLSEGPMKPLWGRWGTLLTGERGQALGLDMNDGSLRVCLENQSERLVQAGDFQIEY